MSRDQDLYTRHVNPELGDVMARLALDTRFVEARGCRLVAEDGAGYLDMTSSYGALPLGHHHPRVVAAARAFLDRAPPNLVKGRSNHAAGEAARRLCERFGAARVIFTNSGSEAVNVALKAARLLTGRRRVVSFSGSYHGNTGDALRATGSREVQQAFPADNRGGHVLVGYDDRAALERALERHAGEVAALLVEPILGEGGVIVPAEGWLEWLAVRAREAGALLVVDEIQTGLGRAGHLSLTRAQGLEPDMLLLSKGLGGGLVPVGACLLREELWDERLGLLHGSTFAGSALAACLVEVVLDIVDEPFLEGVRRVGERLRGELARLAEEFSEVVVEVRGTGLMLGLELRPRLETGSFLLDELTHRLGLVPPCVAHTPRHARVCFATTLNSPHTLRVSPPLVLTEEEAAEAVAALRGFCEDVRDRRSSRVAGFLVERRLAARPLSERPPGPVRSFSRRRARPRVAFLVHANSPVYLTHSDPDLASLPPDELEKLARELQFEIEPVLWHAFPLGEVEAGVFASPLLATELRSLGRRQWQQEVERMVISAREWGARLVGLGGLLSVVTRDGTAIEGPVPVTTGNSLTAHAAAEGAEEARRRHHEGTDAPVAVLGAYGNIGAAVARRLARRGRRVVLLGNPTNPMRGGLLERTRDAIRAEVGSGARVVIGERLEDLGQEPLLVVAATSDPGAPVDVVALPEGSTVLDLAVPPDLAATRLAAAPGRRAYRAARVRPPHPIPDLELLELPPGQVYGCLAETLALAMAGRYEAFSRGPLLDERVEEIGALAARLGFEPVLERVEPEVAPSGEEAG